MAACVASADCAADPHDFHVHHASPRQALDTLHPYTWQPNNNVVPSATALGSLCSPECFATFTLKKAKGPLLQRHAAVRPKSQLPL